MSTSLTWAHKSEYRMERTVWEKRGWELVCFNTKLLCFQHTERKNEHNCQYLIFSGFGIQFFVILFYSRGLVTPQPCLGWWERERWELRSIFTMGNRVDYSFGKKSRRLGGAGQGGRLLTLRDISVHTLFYVPKIHSELIFLWNFVWWMFCSYFDIDATRWFIDGWRDPIHQTVVINIRFCDKRYFVISIGTAKG